LTIVSASNEQLLLEPFNNTFRKHFGVDIKVDVDVVKSRISFGLPHKSIRTINTQEVIYSWERPWEEEVSRDISLMNNYLRSYEEFQRIP
jgi:hypothetical protein